jgi:hypothetical protein
MLIKKFLAHADFYKSPASVDLKKQRVRVGSKTVRYLKPGELQRKKNIVKVGGAIAGAGLLGATYVRRGALKANLKRDVARGKLFLSRFR